MCLLIALFHQVPGRPLVMAANRDERYDRPAEPITVLREEGPRILGGRDLLVGGTWLAVNEHGVVAGLTNQPALGRDPTRRSRGELPLAFAAYPDAATAVAGVCARLDPADYNPCWLLVGDEHALFSVDVTGGHRPAVAELGPGRYVLENVPLRRGSAKQRRVDALLAVRTGLVGEAGLTGEAGPAGDAGLGLAGVLRDHEPAAGPQPATAGRPALPAALFAACVHTPEYGTRSAILVQVRAVGPPEVSVAAGPPCQAPFQDGGGLWTVPQPAVQAGPQGVSTPG